MEKEKLITVSYTVNGFPRFLKGKLITETPNYIIVEGLKDGSLFTIKKENIEERIDKEQEFYEAKQ